MPEQRWDCHGCTRCCRELTVHLFEHDRRKIDEQRWSGSLDAAPYVKLGREFVLNKRDDGACVFLQEDGKCRIHVAHGRDAKPLACRLYPFTTTPASDGWLAALRFDCPSAARSQGTDIAAHRKELRRLAAELPQPAFLRDYRVDLKPNRPASPSEHKCLVSALDEWLSDPSHGLNQRLIGGASLIEMLHVADLDEVREEAFEALLQVFLAGLHEAAAESSAEPPPRQHQALLRELAYVHAEHLTLTEIRSRVGRLTRRLRQLSAARRFRKGQGPVPALADRAGEVTFDQVARITPAADRRTEITSMALRFVRMRLVSRHQYGSLYYGWSMLDGLRGLWAAVAALGWLARYATAARGASEIMPDDVTNALALVDGAMGRAPSLGTAAERLRLRFLARDHGIARLLYAYRLVDEDEWP
jgi:lysine-N-methylase